MLNFKQKTKSFLLIQLTCHKALLCSLVREITNLEQIKVNKLQSELL